MIERALLCEPGAALYPRTLRLPVVERRKGTVKSRGSSPFWAHFRGDPPVFGLLVLEPNSGREAPANWVDVYFPPLVWPTFLLLKRLQGDARQRRQRRISRAFGRFPCPPNGRDRHQRQRRPSGRQSFDKKESRGYRAVEPMALLSSSFAYRFLLVMRTHDSAERGATQSRLSVKWRPPRCECEAVAYPPDVRRGLEDSQLRLVPISA